ncbi:MAG: VWA domain-containing protein [Solirubrobacterales bacterium]
MTAPAANPALPQRCGSNVILVLDESGSIKSSGATGQVRDAARAFLDSLSGTGSQVAIIDFSSSARRQVDYTTVTPDSIHQTFQPYLATHYKPSGFTNWEDAFFRTQELNAQRRADLVVFITDGDPTAVNTPRGPKTRLQEGVAEAMRPAAYGADLVKQQGSHVLVVGVGDAVTKPESAQRLAAISGFTEFREGGDNFARADYTLVKKFAALAQSLRQIVTELCSPSVTVTKLVDEGDGRGYRPAAGWRIAAKVRPSDGGYHWNQPAPPPARGAALVSTNSDGVASFQWETDDPQALSAVALAEEERPGYEPVDLQCSKSAPGRLDVLGPDEYTKCTLRNRRIPVVPPLPPDQPVPPLRAPDPVPPLAPLLQPALVPALVPPVSPPLKPPPIRPGAPVPPLVPIAIPTFRQPQMPTVPTIVTPSTDPPQPQEPQQPPTAEPPRHRPPKTDRTTRLRVVKWMPASARVGQRVRFRITVRNAGKVTARKVTLADMPPASVGLTGLKSSRKARLVRRHYAQWRLGAIKPGQKRVITGSVVLESASPGKHRNRVLAAAVNAKVVHAHAVTRVGRPTPGSFACGSSAVPRAGAGSSRAGPQAHVSC